jgi:hypothetical protein
MPATVGSPAAPAPGRPAPSPSDLALVAVIAQARALPGAPVLTNDKRGFLAAIKSQATETRLVAFVDALLAA